MVNEADVRLFADKCKAIFEQVGRDIIGQEDIVELTVIGKTRLIRSLGRVFSLPFSRIQFTPDLMPADITGTNVLEKDEKGNAVYTFRPGPIFSHIVLADEINRATPKSQSALLEAMQERPRAAQALITCAKVRAMVSGRFNVSHEDIDALACPVLRHRVKLSYEAMAERVTPDEVIARLVDDMKKKRR